MPYFCSMISCSFEKSIRKVCSAGGGQMYFIPWKEMKTTAATCSTTVTAIPVAVLNALLRFLLSRYSFICYSGEVARITL